MKELENTSAKRKWWRFRNSKKTDNISEQSSHQQQVISKPKEFTNKIKKCTNCNAELSNEMIKCGTCGSNHYIWE